MRRFLSLIYFNLSEGKDAEQRDQLDTLLNARLAGEARAESASEEQERIAAEMAAFTIAEQARKVDRG